MPKSAVYSWRVSPETKAALEDAARQERSSVGSLLERAVHEWLGARRRGGEDDEAAQARLHAVAARTFGTIRGSNPHRSEEARTLIRQRLERRHARQRTP